MALARDALTRTLQLLEEGLNPFVVEDTRSALSEPESMAVVKEIRRTAEAAPDTRTTFL